MKKPSLLFSTPAWRACFSGCVLVATTAHAQVAPAAAERADRDTKKAAADAALAALAIAETALATAEKKPVLDAAAPGKKADALIQMPYVEVKKPVLAFFHTGARLLSPYKLSPAPTPVGTPAAAATPPNDILSAAGSDEVVPYVEFAYVNRWAWSLPRIRQAAVKMKADAFPAGGEGQLHPDRELPYYDQDAAGTGGVFFRNWGRGEFWDVDARLGFTLGSGKKAGEADAAAIAGTGDFNLDLTAARQFSRGFYDRSDPAAGAFATALEIGYAVTTDKDEFDARTRLFAGASFTTSFRSPLKDDSYVLLHARVGWAQVDALHFVDETSRRIELTRGDVPHYRGEDAVAFEMELIHPLKDSAHLVLGAKVYSEMKPDAWAVHVGYSVAITDVFKALLGGGEKEKATDKPAAGSPASPGTKAGATTPPPSPAERTMRLDLGL